MYWNIYRYFFILTKYMFLLKLAFWLCLPLSLSLPLHQQAEVGADGLAGGGLVDLLQPVLGTAPRRVVREALVEVVGHGVLGLLLVIGDTGVLKSVAPENFIWKIRCANLTRD